MQRQDTDSPKRFSAGMKFLAGGAFLLFLAGGAVLFTHQQKLAQKQQEESYEASYRAAIIPNDMLAVADLKKGNLIAQGCRACHSFDKSEGNKIGPNLFGIVGRGIAAMDGYEYSEALKALKGKVWTTEELSMWLRDPSEYAPGTKMTFAGMGDPQDRMDLIGYLVSLH